MFVYTGAARGFGRIVKQFAFTCPAHPNSSNEIAPPGIHKRSV
jgi:hypothetical protein